MDRGCGGLISYPLEFLRKPWSLRYYGTLALRGFVNYFIYQPSRGRSTFMFKESGPREHKKTDVRACAQCGPYFRPYDLGFLCLFVLFFICSTLEIEAVWLPVGPFVVCRITPLPLTF